MYERIRAAQLFKLIARLVLRATAKYVMRGAEKLEILHMSISSLVVSSRKAGGVRLTPA